MNSIQNIYIYIDTDDGDVLPSNGGESDDIQGMINHQDNPVDESLEIVEISSELESTISNEKRDHGAPMESMTKRKVEYIWRLLINKF